MNKFKFLRRLPKKGKLEKCKEGLLNETINPKIVQEQLGHGTISET